MAEAGFANNNGMAGGMGGGYGAPRTYKGISAKEQGDYFRKDVAVIKGSVKVIEGKKGTIEDLQPGRFVKVLCDVFLSKPTSGKLINKLFK